jgi:hypothetical protein
MIHEKYIDQLPTTKLRRDLLKVINGYPGNKLTMKDIKEYLIKLGYKDLKDNTLYANLKYLQEKGYIAEIPSPSMGKPSRPPQFYRMINTNAQWYQLSPNFCWDNPMECPDPNCKRCHDAGIKTCWD